MRSASAGFLLIQSVSSRCASTNLRASPAGLQQIGAGDKYGGNRLPVVDQDLSACFHFEARYPGLHSPYRIELTLLEQEQLVRVGGRQHVRITAGLGNFQTAGFKPGAGDNILSISELRGGDFLPRKSAAVLKTWIPSGSLSAEPPFGGTGNDPHALATGALE